MTESFTIESYLERISYRGPLQPSLETLQRLHWYHSTTIPFENLDVLLKKPIRIDVSSLVDKLVFRGRGGYCLEQNLLFMAALQAMGFTVRAVLGFVLWLAPGRLARNHVVLLITLPDGEFLADVGFGGMTLTAPLRFATWDEQDTPHGRYRIVATGHEYQLQAQISGEWSPLYQFNLAEQSPADLDTANWFVSTSPNSIFTKTLMAALPLADRRYALRNNRLSVYSTGGIVQHDQITSSDELAKVLRRTFSLKIPDDIDLSAIAAVAGVS
jgi:N-hydroxyarylamine O-acetyltransferase